MIREITHEEAFKFWLAKDERLRWEAPDGSYVIEPQAMHRDGQYGIEDPEPRPPGGAERRWGMNPAIESVAFARVMEAVECLEEVKKMLKEQQEPETLTSGMAMPPRIATRRSCAGCRHLNIARGDDFCQTTGCAVFSKWEPPTPAPKTEIVEVEIKEGEVQTPNWTKMPIDRLPRLVPGRGAAVWLDFKFVAKDGAVCCSPSTRMYRNNGFWNCLLTCSKPEAEEIVFPCAARFEVKNVVHAHA